MLYDFEVLFLTAFFVASAIPQAAPANHNHQPMRHRQPHRPENSYIFDDKSPLLEEFDPTAVELDGETPAADSAVVTAPSDSQGQVNSQTVPYQDPSLQNYADWYTTVAPAPAPVGTWPVQDQPRGPIVREEALEAKYAGTFTPNAADSVSWKEPEITANCWMQAMLSNKYDFTPQCNQDGSFAAKQCYLERCWCSNRNGVPQKKDPKDRFYYEIAGMMLKCIQNGVPV